MYQRFILCPLYRFNFWIVGTQRCRYAIHVWEVTWCRWPEHKCLLSITFYCFSMAMWLIISHSRPDLSFIPCGYYLSLRWWTILWHFCKQRSQFWNRHFKFFDCEHEYQSKKSVLKDSCPSQVLGMFRASKLEQVMKLVRQISLFLEGESSIFQIQKRNALSLTVAVQKSSKKKWNETI